MRRRWIKKPFSLRASLSIIPHLFTLGNVFFGFYSLVMASQGEYIAAAHFILMGSLMDALDGRIARMMGSAGVLGVQLDSLADAVTFCVAPSFLLYMWCFKRTGFFGIVLVSLMLMAGILRLARFNLICDQQSRYFIGVTTTVVGCFFASLVLNGDLFIRHPDGAMVLVCLIPFLSWLMVSKVKFPAFKQTKFLGRRYYFLVAALIGFAVIASLGLYRALLISFVLYFIFSIGLNFTRYYSDELDDINNI